MWYWILVKYEGMINYKRSSRSILYFSSWMKWACNNSLNTWFTPLNDAATNRGRSREEESRQGVVMELQLMLEQLACLCLLFYSLFHAHTQISALPPLLSLMSHLLLNPAKPLFLCHLHHWTQRVTTTYTRTSSSSSKATCPDDVRPSLPSKICPEVGPFVALKPCS